jgi:hypothetical protein
VSYNPHNPCVYIYALAGYQSGAIAARAQPYDPNEADYTDSAQRADVFAQAVDQAWGTGAYTQADLLQIQSAATAAWIPGRSPVTGPVGLTQAGYATLAAGLVAGVQAGTAQIVAEGVSPNGCGGGGGGGSGGVFVFQPGGITNGNVYASFPALYAAYNSAVPESSLGRRAPATIQVDDSFVSPAIMPAGTYNLDNVTFTAVSNFNTATGGANLQFANGVLLTGTTALYFTGLILVSSAAQTNPILTVSGATQEVNIFLNDGAVIWNQLGGSPLFAVTGGSLYVLLNTFAEIGDGIHEVISVASPTQLEIVAIGGSNITGASVGGAAALTSIYVVDTTSSIGLANAPINYKKWTPWTSVAAGGTGTVLNGLPVKFLVTSSGAQPKIQMCASPQDGQIVILKAIGANNTNGILIAPGAGQSLEASGNPGTVLAANTTDVTHGQGVTITYVYLQSNETWYIQGQG